MPLYEYECEKCGARFEVIQRFSDSPVEACRVCGGPVHKLLSAPAIQFKGTGWYITDYAKKNGSSAAPSAPLRESKSDSTSTTSTDSASSASSAPSSGDAASTAKKD